MAKKSETNFRKKCEEDIQALPYTWSESIQQVSIRATPDKLLCVGGLFVALEFKSPSGKLAKLQEYKLGKIGEAGGYAFEVNPDNWECILAFLKGLAKGRAVLNGKT